MVHEIQYPIIAFAKDGVTHFARNGDDLTICSVKGWKNGFYNGLHIIDSEGNRFDVREAKKIGYVGFLWGISLIFGQRIRVEIIYSKSSEILPVEDFKEKLLKQLTKEKHFWSSGGNFEALIGAVKTGETYKEMISYLTNGFYKEI